MKGGDGVSAVLAYIVLGVVAGIISGLVGIGGGIIIVPALVLVFGMNQLQAQGTTLALLVAPVGLLAAWTYYTNGLVDLKIAGLIIVGFMAGGYLGARVAVGLPHELLQKVFGVVLLLVGIRMLTGK